MNLKVHFGYLDGHLNLNACRSVTLKLGDHRDLVLITNVMDIFVP